MKTASAPLLALLATRQFIRADLFTFELAGGGTYRFTGYDQPLVWDGNTYAAGGYDQAIITRKGERQATRQSIGLEVDRVQFSVLPREQLIGVLSFVEAVKAGIFDGATCTIRLAYMAHDDPLTVVGILTWFAGRVGDIDILSGEILFNVNSFTELLDQPLPRHLFQAGCNNVLFDAGCKLNRASYAVAGVVASGTTAGTIMASLVQATGYFDLGQIVFTSGRNNGLRRTVKAWTGGAIGSMTLINPFPFVPDVADTFTAYPGCDLTTTMCTAKFSNLVNFRGTPFVPIPETAV